MPSLGSSGSLEALEELEEELDELLELLDELLEGLLLELLEELPDGLVLEAELEGLLLADPPELDGAAGVSPPEQPARSAAARTAAVTPRKRFCFNRIESTPFLFSKAKNLILWTF